MKKSDPGETLRFLNSWWAKYPYQTVPVDNLIGIAIDAGLIKKAKKRHYAAAVLSRLLNKYEGIYFGQYKFSKEVTKSGNRWTLEKAVAAKEKEKLTKAPEWKDDAEDLYVEIFAHMVVAGGTGWTSKQMEEMPLGKVVEHLYPNNVRFMVYNKVLEDHKSKGKKDA